MPYFTPKRNPALATSFKKTWQHKLNFTNANILRVAVEMNTNDVKHYVQFDHNETNSKSLAEGNRHVNKLSHRVLARFVQSLAQGNTVDQAFKICNEELYVMLSHLNIYDAVDGYQTPNTYMHKSTLSDKFAKLVEVERIAVREVEYSIDSLRNLTLPKLSMTIPKNSDLASTSTREFIAKPVISEVLLTSILASNYCNQLLNYTSPFKRTDYQVFGSRVVSSHSTGHIKFSSYIAEYNMYKLKGMALAKTYSYFKAFDLKKFFASIDINILADIIAKKLVANNPPNKYYTAHSLRNLVKNLLSFDYTVNTGINDTVSITHDKGLTIESHAQHSLANIFLFEIVSDILNKYSATKHDKCGLTSTISYVDDFIIFGNSIEDVNEIYESIVSGLEDVGINIAPSKTTDTLACHDSYNQVKELIRLPARYYFDIADGDSPYIQDADNTSFPLHELINDDATIAVSLVKKYSFLFLDDGTDILSAMMQVHTANRLYALMTKSEKQFVHDIFAKLALGNSLIKNELNEDVMFVINAMAYSMSVKLDILYKVYEGSTPQLNEWIERCTKQPRNYTNLDSALVQWKHISNKAGSEGTLDGFLINSVMQSKLLKVTDFIYMLQNHDVLSFYNHDIANMKVAMLSDDNILDVLQYLFMTLSTGSQCGNTYTVALLKELSIKILTKYPSKIRFLTSIIRMFFTGRIVTMKEYGNTFYGNYETIFNEEGFSSFITDMILSTISTQADSGSEELTIVSSTIVASESNGSTLVELAKLNFGNSFENPLVHSLIYFAYRATRSFK